MKGHTPPQATIISVPRPHSWKGSALKPYVELPPHTAPLWMEVGPTQACAVKLIAIYFSNLKAWSFAPPLREGERQKEHKRKSAILGKQSNRGSEGELAIQSYELIETGIGERVTNGKE
ncbi:hypothetical protein Tco_1434576 [Tanacetum coccineum]